METGSSSSSPASGNWFSSMEVEDVGDVEDVTGMTQRSWKGFNIHGFYYSPELGSEASDDVGVGVGVGEGLEDVTGGGFVVEVVEVVDVVDFEGGGGDGVGEGDGVGDGSEVGGSDEGAASLVLGSGVDGGSDDRAGTELEFVSRFTIRSIDVAWARSI